MFQINLTDYPHMQWVALSSTMDPVDHVSHSADQFFLLQHGDLVYSEGDPKGTALGREGISRVQMEVTTLSRNRSPAPGIRKGWITL